MGTQLISSDWVNAGRILVTMDGDAVVKVGQQFAGTTPVTAAVVFEDALPAAPSLGQSISIQAGPPQIISFWNRTTHAWVTLSDAERDELLELTDTPSSYSGAARRVLRVNAAETAIEFASATIHDVTDYGAVGDGATDDTVAIQAAVDAAYAAGRGIVLFPPAVYRASSVDLEPGVTLSGYGATLKQTSPVANFTRLITNQNTYTNITGDRTDRSGVYGLTLDGDRANQGTYLGYEKEQSMLLFFRGAANKALVDIVDVSVRETVSDGLFVYQDAFVAVRNLKAWNCYRGGITASGGGARIDVAGLRCGGDVHNSAVNFEIDSPGNAGTYDLDLLIDGYTQEAPTGITPSGNGPQLDGGDGRIRVTRSTLEAPVWVSSRASSTTAVAEFSDCELHWDNTQTFSRVNQPRRVTFSNCRMVIDNGSGGAVDPHSGIRITPATAAAGWLVRFDDCSWEIGTTEVGDVVSAVHLDATINDSDNRVEINGGEIGAGFATAARVSLGGRVHIGGGVHISDGGAVHLTASAGRPVDMRMSDISFGASATYGHITYGYNLVTLHHDLTMPEAANVITTTSGLGAGMVLTGARRIYGALAPTTSDHAIEGDEWVVGAQTWVATNSSHTSSVWAPPVGTVLELTDTPSSYSGEGHKHARVNDGETAIEFLDPTEPVGPNLLTNGSFEGNDGTGLAEGWSTTFSSGGTLFTPEVVPYQNQDGLYSQLITTSGALNPRMYQTISVVVGRTYRMRIRARADVANWQIRLGIAHTGTEYLNTGIVGDSTWQEFEVTAVATDTSMTITCYYNGSGAGTAYFDEASIVEVDSGSGWFYHGQPVLEYASSISFSQQGAAALPLASDDGGGLTIGDATEPIATFKTAGLYEDWAGGTGAWAVSAGTLEQDADGMYFSNASAFATRDVGQSDIDFTYDETYNGDIGGFVARYADATNYIRGYPNGATLVLEYRVGGSHVSITTGTSSAGVIVSGTTYRWRVRIVGDRIRTWRDGEALSDATIPAGAVALQTETTHGFRTSVAGSNRWVRAWLQPVVTGQVLLADQLHIDDAPAYDSDALAGTGGVHAGEVWQTTASHTLGVAGVLMVKQ